MFFWKTSEGGGGSFPIQKIKLQILLVSKRYILGKKAQCNFQKGGRGGVIANPKNFIANLRILSGFSGKKRNVISKNEGGGGSKAVWEFSKKTSILGDPVTPNLPFQATP